VKEEALGFDSGPSLANSKGACDAAVDASVLKTEKRLSGRPTIGTNCTRAALRQERRQRTTQEVTHRATSCDATDALAEARERDER
jgi:hypothetical protein